MSKTYMQDDLLRDVRDIRMEKEKSHLTKLKIWYVIIVVIFAGLVGAGLWYYISGQDMSWLTQKVADLSGNKQSEEPKENIPTWKTYTDTDLGYSFKYPSDWDIDIETTKASGDYAQISVIRVDPDVITQSDTEETVEFWATVYNKKYSAYIAARNKDSNFKNQKSETATLVSIDGRKYTFTAGSQKQNDIVLPLGDDQTITFSYLDDSAENENITNILKSIRFN